jgi:hypothetical protein
MKRALSLSVCLILVLSLQLSCSWFSDDGSGPSEHEIAYDDGGNETRLAPMGAVAGGTLGVVFSSPKYPAKVKSIRVYVSDLGAPQTQFALRIYEASTDAVFGAELLDHTVNASASAGNTWVDIPLPDGGFSVDGDFCAAVEWLTATGTTEPFGAQFLGGDISSGGKRRSWWKFPGQEWARAETVGSSGDKNTMIRAVIEY